MKRGLIFLLFTLVTSTTFAQQSVKERVDRQKDACVISALNKGYVEWDRYCDTVRELNFEAYLEVNRDYYIYFILDPKYGGGELEILTRMDKVRGRVGAIVPVTTNIIQKDLNTPSNGKHYFRYHYKDDIKVDEPVYMCVLIFAKE